MILKYFIYSLGYTLHHLSILLGTYLSKIGNNLYFFEVSEQTCYVYLSQVGETSSHAKWCIPCSCKKTHLCIDFRQSYVVVGSHCKHKCVSGCLYTWSTGICLYYHGSYVKSLLSFL